jgi:hypothetical protein
MALNQRAFFPASSVNLLRAQQGRRWAKLVDRVQSLPVSDPEVIAFSLTLRRLRRSHQLSDKVCRETWCAHCASEVLAHFQGSESDLLQMYQQNLVEVKLRVASMRTHRHLQVRVVLGAA